MAKTRRKFNRSSGKIPYKKLFILAVEGKKTERSYFKILNNLHSAIIVECIKEGHNSSPPKILSQIQKKLKAQQLKNSDEAWIVLDKDQWTKEQLTKLHNWSQTKNNYGLALSNPKFEYWLLLHFEDGKNINSSSDCSLRLEKYLPNYNKIKEVGSNKITEDCIKKAIERGRSRDNPPCKKWPDQIGSTTVYKLVENIIQAVQQNKQVKK
jgi:hypothetical protein